MVKSVSLVVVIFLGLGALINAFDRLEVLKRTAPANCEQERRSMKGDTVVVHYEGLVCTIFQIYFIMNWMISLH